MELTVRPIDVWPEGWRDPGRQRTGSPFRSKYQQTLDKLHDELEHLKASAYHLQLDVTTFALRKDGRLRADAKVGHPGVILTIDTARKGVLVYRTDQFVSQWHGTESWHVNLRAIALGLEALRKIDRYGLNDGAQYAGFAALPPARAMGPTMTMDQAAEFLVRHGMWDDMPDDVSQAAAGVLRRRAGSPDDEREVTGLYRRASRRLHPDSGGDPDEFRKLAQARDLLLGVPSGAAMGALS